MILTASRTAGQEAVEYLATVGPGGTTVSKEPIPDDVDARVEATTLAWKALIIGGASIKDAEAVTIIGDPAAVRALLDATRLEIPPGESPGHV